MNKTILNLNEIGPLVSALLLTDRWTWK